MYPTVDDSWPVSPSDDDPPLEWLLFRQSQVLSRHQALAHLGRGALQNRLVQGRWQRAGRAVVVAHNGPLTPLQQLWTAVLSAGAGGLCAGLTALSLHGLRGYDRPIVDLVVPANRQVRRLPGVRLHRAGVLPDDHVMAHAAPPRTTVARAVVDAATWARTDDDARALVAAAFQQRRVHLDELRAVLSVLPKARRRALVQQTAQYAAGGAHSLAEIDFGRLCRQQGLPPPDQQVVRRDRAGVQRYLDAYWRPVAAARRG